VGCQGRLEPGTPEKDRRDRPQLVNCLTEGLSHCWVGTRACKSESKDYNGLYTRVYTRHDRMKSRKSKFRRPARRGKPFSLWLQPIEKQTLKQLSEKTGVDQTKLIRRGLALLFETFNRGQLELGFPENIRPESELRTQDAGL
jgi:hypothetical protein